MLEALQSLPWPAMGEWFGAVIIFIGLYPLRVAMKLVIPEERIARNLIIKRHHDKDHETQLAYCHTDDCKQLSPGKTEQAVASVSSIHHF